MNNKSTKKYTNVKVCEIHARLMDALGLTQKSALAKLLGISIQNLNNRESRGVNNLDDVELLCNKEKLNREWIFEGAGTARTNKNEVATPLGADHTSLYEYKMAQFDPDLVEIIEILQTDPETKTLILNLLKSRKIMKESLKGLGVGD